MYHLSEGNAVVPVQRISASTPLIATARPTPALGLQISACVIWHDIWVMAHVYICIHTYIYTHVVQLHRNILRVTWHDTAWVTVCVTWRDSWVSPYTWITNCIIRVCESRITSIHMIHQLHPQMSFDYIHTHDWHVSARQTSISIWQISNSILSHISTCVTWHDTWVSPYMWYAKYFIIVSHESHPCTWITSYIHTREWRIQAPDSRVTSIHMNHQLHPYTSHQSRTTSIHITCKHLPVWHVYVFPNVKHSSVSRLQ